MGLFLLSDLGASHETSRHVLIALLLSLPMPVVTGVAAAVWLGVRADRGLLAAHGRRERACPAERRRSIGSCARVCRAAGRWRSPALLQLIAFFSASFEVWFVLRLFGHPIDVRAAVMLESMTQAMRHLAFVVPAGLGVQEAGVRVVRARAGHQ